MKKLLFLSTAAIALALSLPAIAQESTSGTMTGTATVCGPQGSSTGSASTTGTTGTSTETTASTSGTTGSAASTDTTASTSGTTGSGTTTDTAASGTTTTGTATDTAASSGTTGTTTTTSTMALGAVSEMNPQYAESALNNASTNVAKLASISAPSVVCIVDVDALAASDANSTLSQGIDKFRSNNAQVKSAIEGNTQLLDTVKAQHPDFDVNQVLGTDVGPNGEVILFVSRKS